MPLYVFFQIIRWGVGIPKWAALIFFGLPAFADGQCRPKWPDFTNDRSFYHNIGGDSATLVVCSNVAGLLTEDISSLREKLSCGEAAPVIDGESTSEKPTPPLAYIFISNKKVDEEMENCIEKSRDLFGISSTEVKSLITDPRKGRPTHSRAKIPGIDRYEEAVSTNFRYNSEIPFAVMSVSDINYARRLIAGHIFGIIKE